MLCILHVRVRAFLGMGIGGSRRFVLQTFSTRLLWPPLRLQAGASRARFFSGDHVGVFDPDRDKHLGLGEEQSARQRINRSVGV